jgi:hypothetical protein
MISAARASAVSFSNAFFSRTPIRPAILVDPEIFNLDGIVAY